MQPLQPQLSKHVKPTCRPTGRNTMRRLVRCWDLQTVIHNNSVKGRRKKERRAHCAMRRMDEFALMGGTDLCTPFQ